MTQVKHGLIPFRSGHAERVAKVLAEFPFAPEDGPLHVALANAFADELGMNNSTFNRTKFILASGSHGRLEPD